MKIITKIILFLVLIFLIFFLWIYSNLNDSIEEAMKEVKYQKIYYIEKINNEAIVFYGDNTVLSEGYIHKTLRGWKWVIGGGSLDLHSSKDLVWNYTANDKKKPIIFGIIKNPQVVNVKVKELETGNFDKTAKIVELEDNLRLWFVFSEKLIEDYSFMIIGVTPEGREIYYR